MELINLYKLLPALLLALSCLWLVYRVSIDVYESLTGVSVSSARRDQRCTRFENGVSECLLWLACLLITPATLLLLPGIANAVSPFLLVNGGAFIAGACLVNPTDFPLDTWRSRFVIWGISSAIAIAFLMTLHWGLFSVVLLVLFLFGGVVVGWLCHMFMLINRLEDEREKLMMIPRDANLLKKLKKE